MEAKKCGIFFSIHFDFLKGDKDTSKIVDVIASNYYNKAKWNLVKFKNVSYFYYYNFLASI